MNEETIIENRPKANGQQETKKEGSAWKQVTLGGVSGILMGAGLLYAGQAVAQNVNNEEKPEETPEEKPEDVVAPEQGETSHTLENGLKVASVSDDLSFGEAFQQARAEVGPGGVFHWHGGIYNTYSADEWNAMSVVQKHDFAEQVQPEVRPDELSTPTDADTHVVVYIMSMSMHQPQRFIRQLILLLMSKWLISRPQKAAMRMLMSTSLVMAKWKVMWQWAWIQTTTDRLMLPLSMLMIQAI